MPTYRALRHVDPLCQRSPFYRVCARLFGTRLVALVSRIVGWKIDPVLMRLTGGRLGLGLVLPTALLETRGARTGHLRRNVLIYFHDGERITVVASKAGAATHPSWFHNLVANPDVRFAGQCFRAEVVDDDAERLRLWGLADRVFPPYARYRECAAKLGRTIPIVHLLPVERRDRAEPWP